MALSVVNQWATTTGTPDIEQQLSATPGNWLIAIVTWKSLAVAVQPNIAFADTAGNLWYLPATKTATATNTIVTPTGPLNVQVWACPAATYAGWPTLNVFTAIETLTAIDIGSVDIMIFEVAGMGNGYLTVDSVSLQTVSVAGSAVLTVPSPSAGADCLMIAAAAADVAYTSYTTTGAGWTQLGNVTNTSPSVGLLSAWRESTSGGSATFTLGSGTANWATIAVAIRAVGISPSQPNPNWPGTEMQLGFGSDLSTPLSAVSWTTVRNPIQAMDTKRGIQYELGVAQAEPTDVTLRNNDGALSPRDSGGGSGTATASGSTTTFLCSNADAATFNLGDFVMLSNAPSNPNSGFETGTTTGWTSVGGTLTTTTSVGAIGTYAGQMTPNGTTATVQVRPAAHVAVTPGVAYVFSGWLRCAVSRTVELRAIWYDSGGTLLSTNIYTLQIAASTWTFVTQLLTAPPSAASADVAPTMTGTPPATNILYLDTMVVKPQDESTVFKVTTKTAVSGTTTIGYTLADGSGGGSLRATGVGDLLTGVPVDLYTPYRILMAWGGKRHVVTAGWAEQWPETWDSSGFVGAVEMTGTGVLANLTADNPSALSGEIMRRSPYSYWPLGDAQNATNAQNLSGRGTAPLVVTASANGAAGTNAFGASTQGVADDFFTVPRVSSILGDPGNGWQQTDMAATDVNNNWGSALVAHDTSFPAIANGVTIFFVHHFFNDEFNAAYDGTHNPTVAIVKNTDSSAGAVNAVIKFGLQTGTSNFQMPFVTVWDRSTHASTTTQCTVGGQWAAIGRFKSGALSFNRTSWKAYTADGVLSGSGSCNLADKFSILDIGGEADQYANGLACTGIFAHVAVFDRMLTDQEIVAVDSAMNGHQGDEFTANRVQRKLDSIGLTSARIISADGQRVCSVEGTDGSTVADANNLIGGYEDALVFEDAGATYQYRPPELYSTQTSRATLGERADLGEIPYLPGVIADYDATYIYNSITASNAIKDQTSWNSTIAYTIFAAADKASMSKYGVRPLNRDTRLIDGADVTSLVQRLLSRYATRKQRISELSIDPASNPNAWLFCLTVEVGDIVTVMRRPLTAAPISIVCQVLQVGHTTTPGAWKTTLTLAPAP
jgi:Carbohydrate binding domain